ncbi:GNAT family N-acetyltransferase [Acutalibacter sp. 1XD8-36]|uniref:GNAT family N-acetyltransferase n=1 Tax=Acutalibacter sp. 1XD8-36 TaxID=2320852 RepID=UPI0026073FF0|nr:GNAT family N-acetyltransferase [Acutalibacter sp. 1XD8-36]
MAQKEFHIETERLILRRYKSSDLEGLYRYLSDPETVRYEPYRPMSREETGEELQRRIASNEMIAVELRDGGGLIGNVYLGRREFQSMELGFVFNRGYWGNGYASESCRAVLEKAFGEGVHRVYAECDPENENSWRLLEALGFQREGYLRQNVYFWTDESGRPIWKDTYIYGKLHI